MFTDPGRSQFDLNFRLIGIPVRVHPMFWLMSVLLGQGTLQLGFEYLLIWVACVFVSILVHEMGHVVAARLFGVEGEIVLYGFGGLAIPAGQMRKRWQHIVVCVAGPLAGFLMLGFVVLLLPTIAPEELAHVKNRILHYLGQRPQNLDLIPRVTLIREILDDLVWINMVWGLVNLLPVWPLDGGQISRDILTLLSPRSGASIALGISLVIAGLLAVIALMAVNGRFLLPEWVPVSDWWLVIMFGYLAVVSFMALQQERSRSRWTDEHWSRWDEER
jgi:Zn-dependent protease